MRKARSSSQTLTLLAAALTTSQVVWAQEGAAPTPPEKNEASAAPREDEEKSEAKDAPVKSPDSAPKANNQPAPETTQAEQSAGADNGEPTTPPPEAATGEPTTPPPEAATGEKAPTPATQPTTGLTTALPAGTSAFGAYPNPAQDQEELRVQGDERPLSVEPDRVFAEDWWSHTRPTLELHGNFRVRPNFYHNFSLGRIDSPQSSLWPRPAEDSYKDLNGNSYGAEACTPDEAGTGNSDSPADATVGCKSKTQAGADMRFRLEPTIVISDNLRIRSQIDMLGNLVMGTTAQGSSNFPAANGRYAVGTGSGYRPISATSNSATSPVSGVNSLSDAIEINRAWAEYETPFGQLKFGRMADHWGLGILRNAGDDIDGDYQSTVDRISFTTGLPSMGLYATGAWDFMDEGPSSAAFTPEGGQPYDLSQNDDLSRLNLMLYRQMDRQLEKLALSKGNLVFNGGLYLTYQYQRIANDYAGASATCESGAAAIDCQPGEASSGYVRRGYRMVTPDIYGEVKYKKFRFAFEFVTHQGKFDSLAIEPQSSDYLNPDGGDDGWRVNQWALATEIEQTLMEDRLRLGFYFGWSSGDGDVNSLVPEQSIQEQIGDRTISTFRFHPGYRVDLILNRNILSRVQGSYYLKPMAEYDFIRKATGMRVGARAEAIWTRASNFLQTPGHKRDLGIELDGTVYYQSQDGALNDREDLQGGFYSMMQYGVLFPLGGLGYQEDEQRVDSDGNPVKVKAAQTVRAFLGVAF